MKTGTMKKILMNLIQYTLPVENIESIQKINSLGKENIFQL